MGEQTLEGGDCSLLFGHGEVPRLRARARAGAHRRGGWEARVVEERRRGSGVGRDGPSARSKRNVSSYAKGRARNNALGRERERRAEDWGEGGTARGEAKEQVGGGRRAMQGQREDRWAKEISGERPCRRARCRRCGRGRIGRHGDRGGADAAGERPGRSPSATQCAGRRPERSKRVADGDKKSEGEERVAKENEESSPCHDVCLPARK